MHHHCMCSGQIPVNLISLKVDKSKWKCEYKVRHE